jgi:exodeoxyribonuclease VII large subunit
MTHASRFCVSFFMDLFTSIYRVSEIARHLRDVITGDAILSDVWVQGEISDCRQYASGHLYFSLKDEGACIRCVMWKGRAGRLARLPRDGEAVYAHGSFNLYEVRGEVQLYVEELQLIGAGFLYQQVEALKQRLADEGLFDEARKRPPPKFPQRIGVATSHDGAVLHDILHILQRRYPLVEVFLAPTAVQGSDAPPQIVSALNALQRVPDLDVIILARGGGSYEDLFCFNDERVARAIVASRVPVVSGIGHETDFTIADFCADLRAPTPTAAAQFCTPDQNELRATVMLQERRLAQAVRTAFDDARRRLVADVNALARTSPQVQIANRRQQVDESTRAAAVHLQRQITLQRAQLRGAVRHLEALNPTATLERGYALVRKPSDGQVVTSRSQVAADDPIVVRVRDGEFGARVS